ncbi:hypothetical protein Rleg4DRAFT_1807 [Rhizobium leguminosarum bv. trifolii WSM2297]|uniref:Periplasmic protein n=1 Tax=Rhizobium leguminosarum bv. trifolii WSM2297 TaxID=754762 RepID=J0W3B2_RHILT|nr:hypothetical protein [Rhizobium leguminosarum]EJC80191.1 hypothetical protein Rleg4DRAFT_1807 [Rhizobium leguminosarum bv. trifolii WSM2297]
MKNGLLSKLAPIGLACFLSNAAACADFSYEGLKGGLTAEARFHLKGEIDQGDAQRLDAALSSSGITHEQDPWRKIVVSLDSPGGSYDEGLDLALAFRRRGISTVVRSGGQCLSACAIAFLGGTALPKDPNPISEDDPLPDQLPDRSLEPGALLGFHAPYLDLPSDNYDAATVAYAYRSAVLGISRLVAIADRLYVVPAELPKLLAPSKDELFVADDADSVRVLGIDYDERSYQMRDKPGVTRSMIVNGCVNRYYHLNRRSSQQGFAVAKATIDEFIEGSQLMENGEDKIAFGTHQFRQGTIKTWIAYLPIAKTADGKNFVWCLFAPDPSDLKTFYKAAGSVEELFASFKGKGDLMTLSTDSDMIAPSTGDWIYDMIRDIDLVPPDTKLRSVASVLDQYFASEKVMNWKAR